MRLGYQLAVQGSDREKQGQKQTMVRDYSAKPNAQ